MYGYVTYAHAILIAWIYVPMVRESSMADIELSQTDENILDMLNEGRCTPNYIADELDLSRQHITNRLRRLEEHDIITKVHRGLYELVDDPRL
jgi:predicted transcriptional regulator